MEFLPAELLRKKRFGQEHTRAEIRFLVQGYAQDRIPDYQMSAWLMAICLRGMSAAETAWLTEEMRDSGVTLDLTALGRTVDKHSTGGLGDKTSLILAPLVAAAGVKVPMMAGRGLGHTGGTLDKLETIAGFSVGLSLEHFRDQVARVGAAIMGQTREMCPADRKLYALRDVTGTVDSLPLICGSIMSKKLAEGMSALVLDVKFGSGAFMKSLHEAENLARSLMDIGRRAGKGVRALLTRMDEPLGRFVGNAVEVRECLDILEGRVFTGEGKGYDDTRALTLELAGHMIFMGGQAASPEAGRARAEQLLADGSARRKFAEMCQAQGGDEQAPLARAKVEHTVRAAADGYIKYIDLEKLGGAAVMLGAGRRFATDAVDPAAGIEVFRTQGERVVAGAPLFTLFTSDSTRLEAALAPLAAGFTIAAESSPQSPLIAKVLT